jgi:hypothetical protein
MLDRPGGGFLHSFRLRNRSTPMPVFSRASSIAAPAAFTFNFQGPGPGLGMPSIPKGLRLKARDWRVRPSSVAVLLRRVDEPTLGTTPDAHFNPERIRRNGIFRFEPLNLQQWQFSLWSALNPWGGFLGRVASSVNLESSFHRVRGQTITFPLFPSSAVGAFRFEESWSKGLPQNKVARL